MSNSFAADLEPPPPPIDELRPATYDWSGLYIGGWVGNACINGGTLLDSTATEFIVDGCGLKGGALAGYNYQVNDWVLGVEVDYGLSSRIVENTDPGADFNVKFDGLGSARAKLGYAFDDTMVFLTGGLAYADAELSGGTGAAGTPFKTNENIWGWVIGGGIEHAMTDAIRIRLDYMYSDFSDKDFTCSPTCTADVDWGGEHEVRFAFTYAFDMF